MFATSKSVLHRIIPLHLLAEYVATVSTTSVGRGIELPQKKFSGHRASPNENSFGKCLPSEKIRIADKCPTE